MVLRTLFFCSSRRRHTRWPRDWSSDVCSSDLVTLDVDGREHGTLSGRRSFRFEIPLSGEHTVTARAGDLTDSVTLRKVDEVDPATVMPTTMIANWFEDTELPAPDGYF